ncbi:MAG: glycoside hydrolase family 44 protein [Desertimonas sp.]
MIAQTIAGIALTIGVASASSGARPAAAPVTTVEVTIDEGQPGAPISPLIRGINGDLTAPEMQAAGILFGSWGGNPNSRYNYEIGHAWNTAADWEFRNVNYDQPEGDAVREYADLNAAAGGVTRLAVPALGWIAKDDNPDNCSFPDGQGGCQWANWDCANPGPIADPYATSIESTSEMVAAWVAEMVAGEVPIQFLAIDNEPELWGYTHYDVHPECTTFEEVLTTYIDYAQALRPVAPDAELLGPVICCWYDFWRPDATAPDGSDLDFLRYFLRGVQAADESFGQRTLDVLDVHYYPQSNVFNDDTDPETNARRLRSTRSLWDPDYVDESWIDTEIEFLPRLRATVADSYPDTPIGITEWNFGADGDINGALAIADVLGIYGREGVYVAAYWRSPAPGSPGYHAFTMHGNYDGDGAAFEGAVLPATTSEVDTVSVFAALDDDGTLRVMLINKNPSDAVTVDTDIAASRDHGRRFTYAASDLEAIDETAVTAAPTTIELEPSSITVFELPGG